MRMRYVDARRAQKDGRAEWDEYARLREEKRRGGARKSMARRAR
jgi:hypothetical protein